VSRRNPWTVPTPNASDPGRACGTTDGYVLLPRCVCRHLPEVHAISEATKKRKACSASNPDKCPCKSYEAGGSDAA